MSEITNLRTRVTRAINKSLEPCKAVKDFQASKVYSYHSTLQEAFITEDEACQILKRLDRLWKIKTIGLFPEKWDIENGSLNSYGWTVGRRKAVVQVPQKMLTFSYVVHEHCHGVIESYKTYFKLTSPLKEPGHGPLFCGMLAFNMSWLSNQPCIDILEVMRYHRLRVVEESTVLDFKRIFKDLR